MKLDRTAHKAYHFKDQVLEKEHYKGLSSAQVAKLFNYLQAIAYNFEPGK